MTERTAPLVLNLKDDGKYNFAEASSIILSSIEVSSLVASSIELAGTALTVSPAIPVGSVQMYIASAAPDGWLVCSGQVVSQSTFTDLFALVGTKYDTGGEGGGNFRIPDMRAKFPLGMFGAGTIVDLTNRDLAVSGGVETVTLDISEMPTHTHTVDGDSNSVADGAGDYAGYPKTSGGGALATSESTGSDQPHQNMSPFMVLNFIIKT